MSFSSNVRRLPLGMQYLRMQRALFGVVTSGHRGCVLAANASQKPKFCLSFGHLWMYQCIDYLLSEYWFLEMMLNACGVSWQTP